MNDGLEQKPPREERRKADRWRMPVLYLYDHLGGKIMTVTWVGFLVGLGFVTTDYFDRYLLLFGATLGGLILRAGSEDIFVHRTKIQKNGGASHEQR